MTLVSDGNFNQEFVFNLSVKTLLHLYNFLELLITPQGAVQG